MLLSAFTVLVHILVAVVPPQTAEDVLRASAYRHGFSTRTEAEPVTLTSGTRSETALGFPATVEYTRVDRGPDAFREEEKLSIAGRTFRRLTVFDGKAGWLEASEGDQRESEDMSPRKVREYQERDAVRGITSPDRILANKDTKLERLADGTVGETPVYVVRVTRDGAECSTLYVDRKSMLVVKVSMPVPGADGKKHAVEQAYSDFRRVGDCMIAMRYEMLLDGKTVKTDALKSVEFRPAKDYPDSVFRKPQQ